MSYPNLSHHHTPQSATMRHRRWVGAQYQAYLMLHSPSKLNDQESSTKHELLSQNPFTVSVAQAADNEYMNATGLCQILSTFFFLNQRKENEIFCYVREGLGIRHRLHQKMPLSPKLLSLVQAFLIFGLRQVSSKAPDMITTSSNPCSFSGTYRYAQS